MAVWIPAWEELPDDGQEVAVKIVTGGNEFSHAIGKITQEGHWYVSEWPNAHVVAWTPLPTQTRALQSPGEA